MTKAGLMKLVGKKVKIIFAGGEVEEGVLNYADEYSAKHDYRKPAYFYINNLSFKVSHVKKVEKKGE